MDAYSSDGGNSDRIMQILMAITIGIVLLVALLSSCKTVELTSEGSVSVRDSVVLKVRDSVSVITQTERRDSIVLVDSVVIRDSLVLVVATDGSVLSRDRFRYVDRLRSGFDRQYSGSAASTYKLSLDSLVSAKDKMEEQYERRIETLTPSAWTKLKTGLFWPLLLLAGAGLLMIIKRIRQ